MDNLARYADLIGIPFVYKARGPASYDCYGLLSEMFRRDGKKIPDVTSPEDKVRIFAYFANELVLWEATEPRVGVAVVIRTLGTMHCGYMVDDHQMIHTWDRSGGVVIEPIEDWKRRILGFYDYVG